MPKKEIPIKPLFEGTAAPLKDQFIETLKTQTVTILKRQGIEEKRYAPILECLVRAIKEENRDTLIFFGAINGDGNLAYMKFKTGNSLTGDPETDVSTDYARKYANKILDILDTPGGMDHECLSECRPSHGF